MDSLKDFSDSDSDSDNGFNQDLEALKSVCRLTGEDPIGSWNQLSSAIGGLARDSTPSEFESDGSEDGEDDDQLVHGIQECFTISTNADDPLLLKPLRMLPPDCSDNDDCEDDYVTLRAGQLRFFAYNDGKVLN